MPASASPAIKIHRADPKPEVLSAICGRSISSLPSAYRGARVISTDTLRISLVLEVSSREQEARGELRLAAQARIVSMAGVRLDSRKSVRSFKEILCSDISECYHFQWAFALVSACA